MFYGANLVPNNPSPTAGFEVVDEIGGLAENEQVETGSSNTYYSGSI
ncbi:MAG: hypothetical protein KatS3mg110_3361 [Pirellulaceae bacterium]|nr:MAG: hypothetical protein KatS3mg110_3361 [Pirellulaceae bacterium]